MTIHHHPNAVKPVSHVTVVKDVTLVLDTNQYASGDVLVVPQEVTGLLRVSGGTGVLESVVVVDTDDQGDALDLVFFSASAALGTINAAVDISDADAAKILGIVEVAEGDYVDLVNSQVAVKTNLGIVLDVADGASSIYVGAIARGTPTHTASGIILRLGVTQD